MSAIERTNTLAPELERDLVSRSKQGDRMAYGQLVEACRERVFCAALALVRNHEDARDLSQEAFVRVFKSLDRFDGNRPFYPWIYRIVRNLCLDHLERHGPQRRISLDALTEESHQQFEDEDRLGGAAPAGDVRDKIHTEQMSKHLKAAIEELKPEFREIVVMKHLQEMSYKEISDALEIPMGTVMSRLFHARKSLAKSMEKYRG